MACDLVIIPKQGLLRAKVQEIGHDYEATLKRLGLSKQ